MLSPQSAVRLQAAQRIATADFGDGDGEARYATWLRKELVGQTQVMQKLIHAIWGQYPNPDYPRGPGKDPPMWMIRPEPPIPPGTAKTEAQTARSRSGRLVLALCS